MRRMRNVTTAIVIAQCLGILKQMPLYCTVPNRRSPIFPWGQFSSTRMNTQKSGRLFHCHHSLLLLSLHNVLLWHPLCSIDKTTAIIISRCTQSWRFTDLLGSWTSAIISSGNYGNGTTQTRKGGLARGIMGSSFKLFQNLKKMK